MTVGVKSKKSLVHVIESRFLIVFSMENEGNRIEKTWADGEGTELQGNDSNGEIGEQAQA